MARRRQKRSRRRRNPIILNKGITIAMVVVGVGLTTAFVVIRRRRRAAALPDVTGGTGTPQGGGAPSGGGRGTSTNWYRQHPGIVMRLCSQTGAITPADRALLVDEVFLPAWRAALQLLPASPTITQISAMRDQIASNVMRQACTQPSNGAQQTARGLSHSAYLKATGQSGQ